MQYFTYLGNLVQGDLGDSQQSRRPVREDLAEYAPATLELAGTAIAISMVIGVGLGTLAAFRRDRPVDWILRVVSLLGVSIPVFWLALTALYGLTFRWPVFPGSGRLPPGAIRPDHVTGMYTVDALLDGDFGTFRDAVMRLILPALVLSCYAVGLLTRFTRSAVLEVLGNDYVRAAYAKGLADVHDRHPPRPPRRPRPDRHRDRGDVRRPARRHRARRADLRLAGDRHVRLPRARRRSTCRR